MVICETGSKKKNSIYVSLYRPNTGSKRSKTRLKMPRKKKTQNGKITSMLYQVLLRFPQIRATVLVSSRLS